MSQPRRSFTGLAQEHSTSCLSSSDPLRRAESQFGSGAAAGRPPLPALRSIPSGSVASSASAFLTGVAAAADEQQRGRSELFRDVVWNRDASPVPVLRARLPTPSSTRSHIPELVRNEQQPRRRGCSNALAGADRSKISTLTRGVNTRTLATFLPMLSRESPEAEGSECNAPGNCDGLTDNAALAQQLSTQFHACVGLPRLREACGALASTVQRMTALSNPAGSHAGGGAGGGRDATALHRRPLDGSVIMEWPNEAEEGRLSKVEVVRARMAKLPRDVIVPSFADERRVAREPRCGYVAKRIYALKTDQEAWLAFTNEASEWRCHRVRHETDIITRNVESVMSSHPSVKRERRVEAAELRRAHEHAVQRAAEARLAEGAATWKTSDERRAARHHAQAQQLALFATFGARTGRLLDTLHARFAARLQQRRTHAATAIQRVYRRHRRGVKRMSAVCAFVVRARFIRRFMTRVQARTIRATCADRAWALLRQVDFNTRLLFAFRHFHRRVVRAQQLWRSRQDCIAHERRLRVMQWEKAVRARDYDLSLLVKQLEAEAADLGRETLQLTASRHEHQVLREITPARRDEALELYRKEARAALRDAQQAHVAAMDAWHKTPSKQRPPLPTPPQYHHLVPPEQLNVLLRTVCRQLIEEGG